MGILLFDLSEMRVLRVFSVMVFCQFVVSNLGCALWMSVNSNNVMSSSCF